MLKEVKRKISFSNSASTSNYQHSFENLANLPSFLLELLDPSIKEKIFKKYLNEDSKIEKESNYTEELKIIDLSGSSNQDKLNKLIEVLENKQKILQKVQDNQIIKENNLKNMNGFDKQYFISTDKKSKSYSSLTDLNSCKNKKQRNKDVNETKHEQEAEKFFENIPTEQEKLKKGGIFYRDQSKSLFNKMKQTDKILLKTKEYQYPISNKDASLQYVPSPSKSRNNISPSFFFNENIFKEEFSKNTGKTEDSQLNQTIAQAIKFESENQPQIEETPPLNTSLPKKINQEEIIKTKTLLKRQKQLHNFLFSPKYKDLRMLSVEYENQRKESMNLAMISNKKTADENNFKNITKSIKDKKNKLKINKNQNKIMADKNNRRSKINSEEIKKKITLKKVNFKSSNNVDNTVFIRSIINSYQKNKKQKQIRELHRQQQLHQEVQQLLEEEEQKYQQQKMLQETIDNFSPNSPQLLAEETCSKTTNPSEKKKELSCELLLKEFVDTYQLTSNHVIRNNQLYLPLIKEFITNQNKDDKQMLNDKLRDAIYEISKTIPSTEVSVRSKEESSKTTANNSLSHNLHKPSVEKFSTSLSQNSTSIPLFLESTASSSHRPPPPPPPSFSSSSTPTLPFFPIRKKSLKKHQHKRKKNKKKIQESSNFTNNQIKSNKQTNVSKSSNLPSTSNKKKSYFKYRNPPPTASYFNISNNNNYLFANSRFYKNNENKLEVFRKESEKLLEDVDLAEKALLNSCLLNPLLMIKQNSFNKEVFHKINDVNEKDYKINKNLNNSGCYNLNQGNKRPNNYDSFVTSNYKKENNKIDDNYKNNSLMASLNGNEKSYDTKNMTKVDDDNIFNIIKKKILEKKKMNETNKTKKNKTKNNNAKFDKKVKQNSINIKNLSLSDISLNNISFHQPLSASPQPPPVVSSPLLYYSSSLSSISSFLQSNKKPDKQIKTSQKRYSADDLEIRIKNELNLLYTLDVAMEQLNNVQATKLIVESQQQINSLVQIIKQQQFIQKAEYHHHHHQLKDASIQEKIRNQPTQEPEQEKLRQQQLPQHEKNFNINNTLSKGLTSNDENKNFFQKYEMEKKKEVNKQHQQKTEEQDLKKEFNGAKQQQQQNKDLQFNDSILGVQKEISFNLLQTTTSMLEQLRLQQQQNFSFQQQQQQQQQFLSNQQHQLAFFSQNKNFTQMENLQKKDNELLILENKEIIPNIDQEKAEKQKIEALKPLPITTKLLNETETYNIKVSQNIKKQNINKNNSYSSFENLSSNSKLSSQNSSFSYSCYSSSHTSSFSSSSSSSLSYSRSHSNSQSSSTDSESSNITKIFNEKREKKNNKKNKNETKQNIKTKKIYFGKDSSASSIEEVIEQQSSFSSSS